MDTAYAGRRKGTEGSTYNSNGQKSDGAFHADLLGDEDNEPFTFDLDEFVELTPKNQERLSAERHS